MRLKVKCAEDFGLGLELDGSPGCDLPVKFRVDVVDSRGDVL